MSSAAGNPDRDNDQGQALRRALQPIPAPVMSGGSLGSKYAAGGEAFRIINGMRRSSRKSQKRKAAK